MKRQQVIQRILEDFKGVMLITKIKNEEGLPMSLVNSTKFYDNVQDEYEREIRENGNESSTDVHINDTDEMTRIPEITTEELQDAINKLKKGKSPDSDGIRAEDIEACDDETREMVRQIFNEITKQNEFTPEAWKKVKIKVLHKKRDVENVETTARYAHCQRCTDCSRQYCTEDCIHDLTKNKQKTKPDSEAHTRQQITLRRTE